MNRSHTAPSVIWVYSLPEESKLKLIFTFSFSAMYFSPMAVRDSVRDAAANTISDLGSRGLRQDTSGPAVAAMLAEAGFTVTHTAMVPDEQPQISAELRRCADELGIALIVTTGGTGLSPRDMTPEATLAVLDREIRAIPVAMWVESLKITPRAMLSRAVAGTRGRSLILNLPGSEKAARENLSAVVGALEHAMHMIAAEGHG